jgi:molybdate transport system substrate-binding protein
MHFMRLALCAVLLLSSLSSARVEAQAAQSDRPVLVFAAASLTDVLQEIGAAYTEQTGKSLRFSFAASSTLARQIEVGANAEVFVSADVQWMDYLHTRGLIDASSRRDVAGNRLVLIAPSSSKAALRIGPNFPLANALNGGRLAIGDPDIVPAGRYARTALTALGVWNDVARRLVYAENVRTALVYVARGETPLGIVYATDARVEDRVRIVDTFPSETHPQILYPAATMVNARASARAFVEFLGENRAQEVFRRHGFLSVRSAE